MFTLKKVVILAKNEHFCVSVRKMSFSAIFERNLQKTTFFKILLKKTVIFAPLWESVSVEYAII
jgi:hypothetical protein